MPVVKSVTADLLTPVSAFLATAANEPQAFLLESVERGEQIGRYTFLGARPYMVVRARGEKVVLERGEARAHEGKRPSDHQRVVAPASSGDRARAAAVYRRRRGLLRL